MANRGSPHNPQKVTPVEPFQKVTNSCFGSRDSARIRPPGYPWRAPLSKALSSSCMRGRVSAKIRASSVHARQTLADSGPSFDTRIRPNLTKLGRCWPIFGQYPPQVAGVPNRLLDPGAHLGHSLLTTCACQTLAKICQHRTNVGQSRRISAPRHVAAGSDRFGPQTASGSPAIRPCGVGPSPCLVVRLGARRLRVFSARAPARCISLPWHRPQALFSRPRRRPPASWVVPGGRSAAALAPSRPP